MLIAVTITSSTHRQHVRLSRLGGRQNSRLYHRAHEVIDWFSKASAGTTGPKFCQSLDSRYDCLPIGLIHTEYNVGDAARLIFFAEVEPRAFIAGLSSLRSNVPVLLSRVAEGVPDVDLESNDEAVQSGSWLVILGGCSPRERNERKAGGANSFVGKEFKNLRILMLEPSRIGLSVTILRLMLRRSIGITICREVAHYFGQMLFGIVIPSSVQEVVPCQFVFDQARNLVSDLSPVSLSKARTETIEVSVRILQVGGQLVVWGGVMRCPAHRACFLHLTADDVDLRVAKVKTASLGPVTR